MSPVSRLGSLLAAAMTLQAAAQEAAITGSNTIALQQSHSWGDPDYAAYPIRRLRGYDLLDLGVAWRESRYDQWSVSLALRASDLQGNRGVDLNTFTLRREYGESSLPFRVLAGDFNASISTRTSTRSNLKGLYGEIQPRDAALGVLHSVVAFAGKVESPWADLRRGDNESAGLSWLAQATGSAPASAGLHWVRTRLAGEDAVRPARSQDTASFTSSGPFKLGKSLWRWESEIATLRGDPPPTAAPAARRQEDASYYGFVSGELPPAQIAWTLRGERAGADFQMIAGSVASDRRETEATLQWSGSNEKVLDLKWLRAREGVEAEIPEDTTLANATFTGYLPDTRVKLRADASRKTVRRLDGSEHAVTRYFNPMLKRGWGASGLALSVVLQDDEYRGAPERDTRKREAALRYETNSSLGDWRAYVAPALRWTRNSGASGNDRELDAGVELVFKKDHHALSLTLNGLAQRPAVTDDPQVTTAATRAAYTYKRAPHTLTFTYAGTDRHPSPGRDSHGYRATLQWTLALDRPALRPPSRGGIRAFPAPELPESLPRGAGVLPAIPLNVPADAILALLARAGFGPGVQVLDTRVFEKPLLRDVRGLQRLAVVAGPDRAIENIALLIDAAAHASPMEIGRTYDRALREMIERLGRPDRLHVEGALRATMAQDLATGKLVRYAEWELPEGVVRVGIPPRLDGVVRIEIQRARRLASPLVPGWGLEYIR